MEYHQLFVVVAMPVRSQGFWNFIMKSKNSENDSFRITNQAFEIMNNNLHQSFDIIEPFHNKINYSGISPTITTRPEGFKTAILIIV